MKMNKYMNKKPEKVESQIDGFRLPFPVERLYLPSIKYNNEAI